MKKQLIPLLFFLCVFNAFAQNIEYAKEVVQTLASPEFKGRGYVDDGNKIAARYIAKQFKSIGLQPFNKSYHQKFKVDVNTFPAEMLLELDGQALIPGEDYIIDPLSGSLKGAFELIHIKKEDLLNIDKVKSTLAKAEGKVLLVDETSFNIENKEQQQQANELFNFIKYSPKISVAAVIVYTNSKLTWSTATLQASKPIFIVKKQLALENLQQVTININAELINYQTQNIIGYIKGSEEPDSFLVATAHYDHLGLMGAETLFPGANDNASGVAMLLNLAKHFKQAPPKYSMVFMALGAEEIGIVGAKHFVDNPLFDLGRIKFLVNFDLAGTGVDGIKVVNGSVHKQQFKQLVQFNTQKNYLHSVQERGPACNSDHCPFHQKAVPCFYLYTLGGIKAYHDIYDRHETLPLNEFEDYCRLMIDFYNSFE